MSLRTLLPVLAASAALLAGTGCATQVTEQPNQVTRSAKPLGSFDRTLLVKAEILEPYAGQGANMKAVNKVDEVLERELSAALNNLEVVTGDEIDAMNLTGSNTLVVRPIVKQVKFISGGARFFAGSFAGSSVIVMDTRFIDGANGTVLAEPGYYRKASAFGDGFGIGDNRMLNAIAEDVGRYAVTNR